MHVHFKLCSSYSQRACAPFLAPAVGGPTHVESPGARRLHANAAVARGADALHRLATTESAADDDDATDGDEWHAAARANAARTNAGRHHAARANAARTNAGRHHSAQTNDGGFTMVCESQRRRNLVC